MQPVTATTRLPTEAMALRGALPLKGSFRASFKGSFKRDPLGLPLRDPFKGIPLRGSFKGIL